jgi:hypothetical protein
LRTIIINRPYLLALTLLGICATASAAHEYDIALDQSLNNMTVVARFDRPVNYIAARSRYAGRYLREASDCDSGLPLKSRGRRLELPADGIRCLRYTTSLRSAERDAAKIVISPTLWMWRPRLARDDEILAACTGWIWASTVVTKCMRLINRRSRFPDRRSSPRNANCIEPNMSRK